MSALRRQNKQLAKTNEEISRPVVTERKETVVERELPPRV
jgi:hypothetical protein